MIFADLTLLGREDFLAPLFFIEVESIGGVTRYETLERLKQAHEETGRNWSGSGRVLDTGPMVEIVITPTNNMLAVGAADWDGSVGDAAAATDPNRNPITNNGIDYLNLRFTLTARLDYRVQVILDAEKDMLHNPDDEAVLIFQQIHPEREVERTLYIDVPKKRLDYVVPYTCVAIVEGEQVFNTAGGFVRDDRDAMRDIAKAARDWYGKKRQALTLTFKQVRPIVELGWLITDVGANYNIESVNTVVTDVSKLLNP